MIIILFELSLCRCVRALAFMGSLTDCVHGVPRKVFEADLPA